MRYDYDMQLIVHAQSRRILSFTPRATFQMPARIVVVSTSGIERMQPSEWTLVTWQGEAPRGFTAQTCYLFMLGHNGFITEAKAAPATEQVVI